MPMFNNNDAKLEQRITNLEECVKTLQSALKETMEFVVSSEKSTIKCLKAGMEGDRLINRRIDSIIDNINNNNNEKKGE